MNPEAKAASAAVDTLIGNAVDDEPQKLEIQWQQQNNSVHAQLCSAQDISLKTRATQIQEISRNYDDDEARNEGAPKSKFAASVVASCAFCRGLYLKETRDRSGDSGARA